MSKVQELIRDAKITPNRPSDGSWKNKSTEILTTLVAELASQNEEFRRRFDQFENDLKSINGRTQLLIQESKVLRQAAESMDQASKKIAASQTETTDTKGE